MGWEAVEKVLPKAHSIAFDSCHKIYVLMDAGQTEQMKEWDYAFVFPKGERIANGTVMTEETMLALLHQWFDDSCGLRFIHAVKSPGTNDDFTTLIEQFEFDQDEFKPYDYESDEEGEDDNG